MDLSVVVNFYNMQREAARTLRSLSRGHQQGIGDLQYEVLCLDNGSKPPLEQAFIESFGPEFRLVRPDPLHPSPVGPINRAAAEAKGKVIAVMIDGAHVLTPGVIREAMEVFRHDADAVVAVRQWFVGGDQRWLAANGYTREHEDKLFDGIEWPNDGYGLFRIGVPVSSFQFPWFRGMAESNCLFMSMDVWRRIGGFDEGFDEPGAGLANLDLFSRACDAATGSLVALLGEASFHQFHEGTTTNVSVEEKDRRVREYMIKYQEMRGQSFRSADTSRLSFRGAFADGGPLKLDRRPTFPRGVRLTDAIRPISFQEHFEGGTRSYLISTYTEANLDTRTSWLGHSIDLYPADLVALQEIMTRTRPTHVVLAHCEPALAVFADSILKLLGVPSPVIIWASRQAPPEGLSSRLVSMIDEPSAPKTLRRIEEAVGTAESTLVLYGADATPKMSAATLADYARFVAHRCYLVVLRTCRGQPWIGYARLRALRAINDMVAADPSFVVDTSWERNVLTSCPSGFVFRVGEPSAAYDESLDRIPEPVATP